VIPDSVSVDRLPSFITGPQPQIKRRPRAVSKAASVSAPPPPAARPTPDGLPAPVTPSDDFNTGNE